MEGIVKPANVEGDAYYIDDMQGEGKYVLEITGDNIDAKVPVRVLGCGSVWDIDLSDLSPK